MGGGFNFKNLPWEGYGYFLEQHIIIKAVVHTSNIKEKK